jgi:hypothetical protein
LDVDLGPAAGAGLGLDRVDVVGQVEHGALGVDAERGGDELRAGAVDQGGQPGAADGPRADAGRIE